jgi:hypothetical protein
MTIEERLKARGTPATDDAADEGNEAAADADEAAGNEDAEKGADADEGADAAEGADEDGEIKDGEVEGLSPKAQAKINKRIHEINIKRKNAETKAEQTEAQFKILNAKLQDENIKAAIKLGFDPNYGTAEDAKMMNRVENLQAWRSFYRDHADNGYEGSGAKDDQSMSATEVKRRLYAVEDELMDIGGPTRSKALERQTLKDADAAVGRKIRLEGANKSTTTPQKKVNPRPPKLPENNGATRRPPVSAGSKGKPVFDKEEFNKSGGDKAALGKAYEGIYRG